MREDLLATGVSSLSKAGTGDNWFAGHFGGAIISGYFLLNEFGLEPSVTRLIEARLDRTVETFDAFFPTPPPAGQPVGASAILQQLESLVLIVANSGHGVIYGSLALRAMQIDPGLRTAVACQNIATLLAAAGQHDPEHYYGVDDPASIDVPEEAFPEASSLHELTQAAISECALVYADQAIASKRHFLQRREDPRCNLRPGARRSRSARPQHASREGTPVTEETVASQQTAAPRHHPDQPTQRTHPLSARVLACERPGQPPHDQALLCGARRGRPLGRTPGRDIGCTGGSLESRLSDPATQTSLL